MVPGKEASTPQGAEVPCGPTEAKRMPLEGTVRWWWEPCDLRSGCTVSTFCPGRALQPSGPWSPPVLRQHSGQDCPARLLGPAAPEEGSLWDVRAGALEVASGSTPGACPGLFSGRSNTAVLPPQIDLCTQPEGGEEPGVQTSGKRGASSIKAWRREHIWPL